MRIHFNSILIGALTGLLCYSSLTIFKPDTNQETEYQRISFADAIKAASPSIVKIVSSDKQSNDNLGSGVIIHSRGIIVTNFHVVGRSSEIKVILPSGKQHEAKMIGYDQETDLAILHIDAEDLPAIKTAQSTVQVGDVVMAIGHPYEVGQTVTQGIVSGLGRANLGLATYENFIQTDADINPGNSGGALIDTLGNLVGINTAIFSQTNGSQGIGFAIPVEMTIKIVNDVLEFGHAVRGYLGVSVRIISKTEKHFFEIPEYKDALLVLSTGDQSPAQKYGLLAGDLILKINDAPVKTANNAHNLVGLSQPGDTIKLSVKRGQSLIDITATLSKKPISIN